MSFSFTIQVTCCAECPHFEKRLYGPDCNLNNLDWAFTMKNPDRWISKDCPYRGMRSKGI